MHRLSVKRPGVAVLYACSNHHLLAASMVVAGQQVGVRRWRFPSVCC